MIRAFSRSLPKLHGHRHPPTSKSVVPHGVLFPGVFVNPPPQKKKQPPGPSGIYEGLFNKEPKLCL